MRRFDGSAWVEVGTNSASAGGVSNLGGSAGPSLHLDSNDVPWLAWSELVAGRYEVYLKRFDGIDWVEVAGSASGRGLSADAATLSGDVHVRVDANGFAVVAWIHREGNVRNVYVKRFDGTAWVELAGSASGGISNTGFGSGATTPTLVLDRLGYPIVAWQRANQNDSTG